MVMKKICLFLAVILSFVLALTVAQAAMNCINLLKAKGTINLEEIGGKGLYVFSLWDKHKAFVGLDAGFLTVISDSRPQKLSVKDSKGLTRALAIALPKNTENILFDAKSTALAILFDDPALFATSAKVENLSRTLSAKKSFQELVAFFRSNLPVKSLEELESSGQCMALIEKCNGEIYGKDQTAIRKSLYEAQGKLQKLFQEN